MKINRLLNSSIIAAFFLMASCSSTTESEESNSESQNNPETKPNVVTLSHSVDPENSTIQWKGEMMGMYSHEGTINFQESYITTENGELVGGGFIVDMSTITPTDDNFKPKEGKTKEKLVGHLKSPDFFDVANYPKAMFDIIEVNEGSAKGLLSIRDKRLEEVVQNLNVEKVGNKMHLTGTLTFDRQKYNVAFSHPMKEMVISDNIELNIDIMTNELTPMP